MAHYHFCQTQRCETIQMKQTITRDELSELIHRELNQFIGRPNDHNTRQDLFNLIKSLIEKYPEHLNTIEEIIKEGPKDGNSSQA